MPALLSLLAALLLQGICVQQRAGLLEQPDGAHAHQPACHGTTGAARLPTQSLCALLATALSHGYIRQMQCGRDRASCFAGSMSWEGTVCNSGHVYLKFVV
jgi:hypothetical protein